MPKKRKTKSVMLNMRARSADIADIDRAAGVAGVTRSAFIRGAAVIEARRVIAYAKSTARVRA